MTFPGDDETKEEAAAVERAMRPVVRVMLRAAETPPVRVTAAQLAALAAVERRGDLGVVQLAEELGTIPSWASRLCDRLEAAGYVERKSSPEGGRQLSITLRPDGRRVLAELQRRRRNAIATILLSMTASERRALVEGLSAFAAGVERSDARNQHSA